MQARRLQNCTIPFKSNNQAVVGTRHPTHHIPSTATMEMVTWPNPGSPAFVTSQMEEAETSPINPQITIFE
jgi:hypothetical protein